MTDVPDSKVVAIVATVLDNAHDLVSAYDHLPRPAPARFNLAACCAVAQEESGGRNVWGGDPWDAVTYPKGPALPPLLQEHPVTEICYHNYKLNRDAGRQPQGCGPLQLTAAALQVSAERAGGCWVPFYNALIGFRYLRSLFLAHGTRIEAFAAYNGSGPAADAYGQRVSILQLQWQVRLG